MSLTTLERVALRAFGWLARRQVRRHARLRMMLDRAHMPQGAEVYLSLLDLLVTAAFLEGLVVLALVVGILPRAGVLVPIGATAVATLAPLLLPLLVYIVGLLWPEVRAAERAAEIDARLPGALNYMAAMASSGMTPDKIVSSLSRQRVYGEAAEEARWVDTQVRWLGRDLLTAFRFATSRSPSNRMQDVWQGTLSTLDSGASLKTYLLAKAEQMHRENALAQRQSLETLGIMAESFMVVAVAMPVFLILLLTVMGSSGPGAATSKLMLWVVVLVLVPSAQAGFAFAVHSMRRRL